MISVYDFTKYQEFIGTWINSRKTRGLQGQLASAMRISSSMMSQILRGTKSLTLEQGLEAALFFELGERETDFFMLLVEFERAGSQKLKLRIRDKIDRAKTQARQISNRVKKDAEVSEEAKSIYYSDWVYTGVRNLTAVSGMQSASQIAARLSIPLERAVKVLQFLIEHGLCVVKDSGFSYGPAHTHTGVDSPHANRHHQNWRHRAINQMSLKREHDLFYTAPVSLSATDAELVRNEILKNIEAVLKIIGPSSSEVVRCINFDFFEY